MEKSYTHPDVLVSTDWLQEHLNDPDIRIVESNEDILLYDTGHIPNAVKIDWQNDLQDSLIRDYINEESFAKLMSEKGISNDTTIVFYGDKSNWWACYAFWTFVMYGHQKCKLLNGGRQKWISENRELTREKPCFAKTEYSVGEIREDDIRAFRKDVMKHIDEKGSLIDVRSPGEYTGELLHMPDYPQEGSLRGGHIPGAKSVPWSKAAKEDGTFKNREELESIYEKEAGLQENKDVIVYCRIGERSSHTWFVLTYLLGYKNVRNYDGSWTEWGNLVRVPIEKTLVDKAMNTIDEIISDFKAFSSQEKLEVLMEYSDNLPDLPEKYHAERDSGSKRIHECQTPVHMWVEIDNENVFIFVDIPRESPTVRGFTSILIDAFHGKNYEDALNCPNNLLHSLGLVQVLGMTRLNGLSFIIQRLKREITEKLAAK